MKKILVTSMITLSLAMAGSAQATNFESVLNPLDHATRTEVKAGDTKLQKQIDANKNAQSGVNKDLQSQITQHGYEINTQAKYTTSVNEDLQATKASQGGINAAQAENNKQQQNQLNAVQNAAQIANEKGDVNAVRQDVSEANIRETNKQLEVTDARSIDTANKLDTAVKAGTAAYTEVKGDINNVNKDLQDSKAAGLAIAGQLQGQIGQTNQAVKAVDDKVNINKANQDKVNTAQTNTNNQVQGQIKTVDGKVNTAQATADTAFSNSLVNDKNINTVNNKLGETIGVVNQHTNQIQSIGAQTNTNTRDIATNKQEITNAQTVNTVQTGQILNQIKVTNAQGKTLVDHDARISGTEQKNVKQDQRLDVHDQRLNEYGQKFDVQDSLNSQFAADIGNTKAQMAGVQSQLNSQGKEIKQLQKGLAGVAALASIQFNTDPEAGFQVGCGVAQIRSNNGQACGAGGAINKNWFAAGYVMQSSSESGVAASATYSFGR